MIRWPISFWNYNSYFTFRFSIFQYSYFHILFSHIQILCWRTDVRSNVEQLAVLKLLITKLTKANRANQVVTKITKPNPKYKSIPAAISTAENHGRPAITENHEGDIFSIWKIQYLFLNRNLGTPHKQLQHLRCDVCPWSGRQCGFQTKTTLGAHVESRRVPNQLKASAQFPIPSTAGALPFCLLITADQGGKIGNNSVSEVVDFAHNAPCTVHLCFEINRKHLKYCFLV